MNNSLDKSTKIKPSYSIIFVLIICIIGGYIGLAIINSPENEVQTVTVDDFTGENGTDVLDDKLIKDSLTSMKSYKDINILVYAKNGQPQDNLNEDTLNYVRENHPNLISGDKWSNGWLIIALNVESQNKPVGSGQIGTYFGEDIKVGESTQENLQSQGYDFFKQRDWSQGIIAIGETATKTLGTDMTGILVYSLISLLILSISVFTITSIRYGKKMIREATDSLNEQTVSVDNYVTNADNTLVGDYVERVRENSHEILIKYTELLDERDRLKNLSWLKVFIPNFLNIFSELNRIKQFRENVYGLSHEIELVSDTMKIYEREKGWEDIWIKQTLPTRKMIREMKELDSDLADNLQKKLDRIDAGMYGNDNYSKDPSEENENSRLLSLIFIDNKFFEVDEIHKTISDTVKQKFVRDIENIDSFSKRKYIKESVENQVRENQRNRSASIFDYYSPSTYYTYGMYSLGYDQGLSNYNASQTTSSSSFSTTGYGGSGGGFSGAGSSTSF